MEGLSALLLLMQLTGAISGTGAFVGSPGTSTPAITQTDCATDFADLLPSDNRFDDRLIADWGDRDKACDFWPQSDERPDVF